MIYWELNFLQNKDILFCLILLSFYNYKNSIKQINLLQYIKFNKINIFFEINELIIILFIY